MVDLTYLLIVDDDPPLRFTFSVILRRTGYPVKTAENAAQALLAIAEYPISLVFLDLGIPGMNGLELLEQLHCTHPDLPVVILTGDNSLESTLKALRLGARGYLLKPLLPGQVITCVEQILGRRRQPRPAYP